MSGELHIRSEHHQPRAGPAAHPRESRRIHLHRGSPLRRHPFDGIASSRPRRTGEQLTTQVAALKSERSACIRGECVPGEVAEMPGVQPRDQGHLLGALRQRNSTHTEAGLVADVIESRIELQFV